MEEAPIRLAAIHYIVAAIPLVTRLKILDKTDFVGVTVAREIKSSIAINGDEERDG